MIKRLVMTMFMFAAIGCTDTFVSSLGSYGSTASIICYSGGIEIYNGKSTGKVESAQGSDGYLFRDSETGKLTEISGNCILRY